MEDLEVHAGALINYSTQLYNPCISNKDDILTVLLKFFTNSFKT